MVGMLVLFSGCRTTELSGNIAKRPTEIILPTLTNTPTPTSTPVPTSTPTPTNTPMPTSTPTPTNTPVPTSTPTPTNTPMPTSTPTPTNTPVPTNTPIPSTTDVGEENSFVIVIDAGHQRKGNYEKEPNGPGSDVMKAKVSSGTQGVVTGLAEYELNLTVSLFLKEELLARGYEVIMIRETHDVNISNVERAKIANEVKADAFIRVHADSSTNQDAKGVMTICQTKNNPYNREWYEESRKLSELVLEEVVQETGAKKRQIWETDTMTGINWTTVPTTILEMGFMSNKEEDKLLATQEYQRKIAKGVADAIDRFLKE